MFTRTARTQQQDFPEDQTMGRLSWLSRKMNQHNQTIFLIEQMQPSWLSSELQQWLYLLACRLICGLLIGLSLGLIFMEAGFFTGFLSGIMGGLVTGIVTGLHFLWSNHHVKTRTLIRPLQLPSIVKTIINVLNITVGVGISTFIIFQIGFSQVLSQLDTQSYSLLYYSSITTSILVAVLVGIGFGILFGLKAHGQDLTQDIQTIEALSWSWKNAILSAKKGIIIGLVIGSIIGIMVLPFLDFSYRSSISLLAEKDQSLQGIAELNERFPPILFVCCFTPYIGILGSVISFILGGLFGGLQGTLIQSKVKPNEGIRLSIRNAIIIALFIGLPIGLIAGLIAGLIGGVNLAFTIVITIVTILFVGLPAFLWYGGLAIIQHYALRLILFLKGYIPWNYDRFLNYAAEHVFLRKVGGSYIFIHRFLQEYFASLPISSIQAHKVAPPG